MLQRRTDIFKTGAIIMRRISIVCAAAGIAVPTFEDALIVKDGFLHMGACAF